MSHSINKDRIEQYLLDKMTEAEKGAFQLEMLQNKALREEVKATRQLQKTLIAEKKMMGSSQSAGFNWKWLLPLLLLSLVPVASIYIYNKNKEIPIKIGDPRVSEYIENTASEVSETPIVEPENSAEIIETPEEIPEKEIRMSPPVPIEKVEEKVEKEPRPIAGNYELDPILETELGDLLRGDYNFTISEPIANFVLKIKNERVEFQLTATLETEKTPEEDFSLLLEIYSNEKGAFTNELPELQLPISFSETETPFSINTSIDFDAERRLYYYLLRDDYSGAVLTGGKFRVE